MRTDAALPPNPVPFLALPFAIVGFSAGWLAVGVLENPVVYRSHAVDRTVASLIAAAIGAAVGFHLSMARPRADAALKGRDLWRLALPVVLAGGLAGLVIALQAEGWTSHTLEAGLFGVGSAIAFLPVCRAVVLSARRSARARMGSLVARADRRAVWSILATCVGLATLAATIDWPAARYPIVSPPWLSLGLAIGAALVVFGVRLADARAARQVSALASQIDDMDACDLGAMAARSAPVRIDLGLGDEAHARVEHGVSGYRDRERATALLLGTPAPALDALQALVRRGTISCVALLLVLGAHFVASRDGFAYLYQLHRCEQMNSYACAEAAQLAPSPAIANTLYRRACDGHDWESCDWLAARGLGAPR